MCHNYLKLKVCNLKMFGNKTEDVSINIGSDVKITESENERLFGVSFDNKLNFRTHINDISKKAAQKLHALARLSDYVDFDQLGLLINSLFKSQLLSSYVNVPS